MRTCKYFLSLVAMFLMGITMASAQSYFDFADGIITPEPDATVDELNVIVIDYSACGQVAKEGLNPYSGKGAGWLSGSEGSYDVTWTDDYEHCKLTLKVVDGPVVKAGDYCLRIPENVFNAYDTKTLVNDATSFFWTVNGTRDNGDNAAPALVSSYPADGEEITLPVMSLKLTFDQDIQVNHSAFDAAGIISDDTAGGYIQLAMVTEGNVVTITKGSFSSADFAAGHRYTLELYANKFYAAVNPTKAMPATTIHFSVAAAEQKDVYVVSQIPAAGEKIINAGSVTFNRNVTAVDKSKITLVNDKGVVAPLSLVGRDGEAPANIIFNIKEGTVLQPGTTYMLHLEAGAVTCGEFVNEEMDAAYWNIPIVPFTFTAITPEANRAVPSFQSILLISELEGNAFDYAEGHSYTDIKVTGVQTNQDYVYAVATEAVNSAEGLDITFDKLITPEVLAAGGALYNSVKVIIPEGTFVSKDGRPNAVTNIIIYVMEERTLGEQTWTFSPASGSTVESLGYKMVAEGESGNEISYVLRIVVSGENVYARIPDASAFRLVNGETGATVKTFAALDITTDATNRFFLDLGAEPITADGVYELIIPRTSVELYTDAGYITNAQHPDQDVIATWTVANPDAISTVNAAAGTSAAFTVSGQRLVAPAKGINIISGRKVIKK